MSLQVLRQEQIRGLIKGNSTAKTELINLHREVWISSICANWVDVIFIGLASCCGERNGFVSFKLKKNCQEELNFRISLEDFYPSVLFQLLEFIPGKLLPQFEDVTTAANSLRNSISKEAKHFGAVSLLALDRRTVEG